MKKAFKWLDKEGIEYGFHDYKKGGFDADVIRQAVSEHGWETVINKRGTTWRKLDEKLKTSMDAERAIKVAGENPSIVKRPLILYSGKTYVGYDEGLYKSALK